ncbi:proteinase inhibitor-like [Elaeis guineensis]|uniref:proteinase inhibitor-like n=1 Tax=Elaeis guineensis var. tenera TaxID=51953 RepID=UPI003C6D63F5
MGGLCRRSPDPGGEACPGKKAWPELVLKKADVAVSTIESENRYIDNIQVVRQRPPQVECCNRVFVVVDDQDTVVEIPYIG